MRIGITEMPENGFVLQPLIGTRNVLIKLYRSPEESYDSDGNKHITANVVVLTRRNYSGIAQSIEDNLPAAYCHSRSHITMEKTYFTNFGIFEK